MDGTKFGIGILLFLGSGVISLVSFGIGWITNVTEYTILVISGIVVAMVLAGGTLIYKSVQETRKKSGPTGIRVAKGSSHGKIIVGSIEGFEHAVVDEGSKGFIYQIKRISRFRSKRSSEN